MKIKLKGEYTYLIGITKVGCPVWTSLSDRAAEFSDEESANMVLHLLNSQHQIRVEIEKPIRYVRVCRGINFNKFDHGKSFSETPRYDQDWSSGDWISIPEDSVRMRIYTYIDGDKHYVTIESPSRIYGLNLDSAKASILFPAEAYRYLSKYVGTLVLSAEPIAKAF